MYPEHFICDRRSDIQLHKADPTVTHMALSKSISVPQPSKPRQCPSVALLTSQEISHGANAVHLCISPS